MLLGKQCILCWIFWANLFCIYWRFLTPSILMNLRSAHLMCSSQISKSTVECKSTILSAESNLVFMHGTCFGIGLTAMLGTEIDSFELHHPNLIKAILPEHWDDEITFIFYQTCINLTSSATNDCKVIHNGPQASFTENGCTLWPAPPQHSCNHHSSPSKNMEC